MIGFAFEGKPVAGIIHQPYYQNCNKQLGRTLYGIVGIGTYGFQHTSPPSGRRIVISTKSRISPVVTEAIKAMNPDKVVHVGGAGYKTVLILEGNDITLLCNLVRSSHSLQFLNLQLYLYLS